jgi:SAM-dependent methyltransferase
MGQRKRTLEAEQEPPERRDRTMSSSPRIAVDVNGLRVAVQQEYRAVAREPHRGYHFHTGRPLTEILGYEDEWLEGVPEGSIDSFAGTGNPFRLGRLNPGEYVVDVGCGAGIDSFIASRMVAPNGHVVGVDMTPAMLDKARRGARETGTENIEFRRGLGEELPVPDEWADVIISNGVLNLMPDKAAALSEMARVLKPGGRLQIGDIMVQKPVSEDAKQRIDLWTG